MGQFSSTFKKIANILRYRILYPIYRSGKSLPTNKESIPPFKKSTAYLNIRLAKHCWIYFEVRNQRTENTAPMHSGFVHTSQFCLQKPGKYMPCKQPYVSYELYDFQLDTCKSTSSVTCWTAASESHDLLLPLGHSIWALKIK